MAFVAIRISVYSCFFFSSIHTSKLARTHCPQALEMNNFPFQVQQRNVCDGKMSFLLFAARAAHLGKLVCYRHDYAWLHKK